MRKLLLTFVFGLLLLALAAQTWDLPDVEVPVESPIKAYIYKKPVVYRSNSINRIPSFLPALKPSMIQAEIPMYKPPLFFYASSGLNDKAENSSHFVLYPYREWLKRADLKLDWQPRLDLHSSLNARLETDYLLDQNQIGLSGQIQNAKLDAYSSSLNQLSLDHYHPGIYGWSRLHTRLAYSFLNQTDNIDFKSQELRLDHSAKLRLTGQNLGYTLNLEHGQSSVLLEYDLPALKLQELKPSLGLLSDLNRVFPALGFTFYSPLVPNHSIFVSQYASLESNSYARHLEQNPWQNLTRRPPMILKPLNLKAAWEFCTDPIQRSMLRSGSVTLTSSYATGQAYYTGQALSKIPKLGFSDQLNAALTFNAELEDRGYKLKQLITFNLSHQEALNWARAAYSPLLELNTSVTRNWDKHSFSLSLEQRYNQHDHQFKQMKDTVDASLQTAWKICRDWQIQARLNRMFNTKLIQFNGLPSSGRELWIGVSYYGR